MPSETIFVEFGLWMMFAVLSFVTYEALKVILPSNTALWYWLFASSIFLLLYFIM